MINLQQNETYNEIYMAIELSEDSVKAVVAEYFNMKPNILASIEKDISYISDEDCIDDSLLLNTNEDKNSKKKTKNEGLEDLKITKTKEAIFALKDEITALLGYEIKNTILVMPSNQCKKFSDKARVEPISADKKIIKDDIARGIDDIIKKNTNEKNFVVNVVVDRYSAYNYGYVSNPQGLETRYIELEASVYSIPTSVAYPMLKVIEECEFNVVDVCLDILGIVSEAILPSSLKSGAVVVDMSASNTNIAYFKNNTLRSFKSLNLGGNSITNDISLVAKIDKEKAESFKRKFVDLDIDKIQDLIIYKYYDEASNENIEISQKFLSEVALSRQKEIISLVCEDLDLLELTSEDVVYFTGGANRINDLDHLLKYEMHYPYRIISSNVLGARNSGFIKCIGAIIYQAGFSRIKGEVKLFVNKKEYSNSLNLVEKNNLLYNNNSQEQDFIKRLVSYIFNN
jgi:cell division protein FtsA